MIRSVFCSEAGHILFWHTKKSSMKAVWSIVHSSLRGYRTFGRGRKSSWNSVTASETLQPEMFPENANEFDESNEYDPDLFASDFSNLSEMDKMHEQEISIEKKKIQTCLIKRKYFKNREPATLTWGEREQIRHLHSEDPEEWSVERLTESFPASEETIKKILRSKWLPSSVKVIVNYDAKVKNNWTLFKAGKLAVDPELHAHLSKFKNRIIEDTNEEKLKNFVRTKPKFPNPTSVMFSNIIQGYDDHRSCSKENPEHNEKAYEKSTKKLSGKQLSDALDMTKITSHKNPQKATTCDVFLERYTQSLKVNELSPVDRVIVDETKQKTAEAYKTKSLVLESKSIVDNFKAPECAQGKNKEIALNDNRNENSRTICPEIDENLMETGIIARQKKNGVTPDDYPQIITIAEKNYKPGAIYRIQDRYYDDDGEFLYRVPGIFS